MGGPTRDGTAEPASRDQISGANGDGERRKSVPEKYKKQKKQKIRTETTRRKKLLARKRRRRGRAGRRVKRREAESEREKVRRQELTIATHNVRTMAVDGKHGVGRAADVLSEYEERDCDIIGLQETRRSGQSALVEAGYVVYCSGEGGGEGGGKKGQGGVGLAIRRDIIRAQKDSPGFISERLLKVTLELCGRARAVTFVVAYAPTDTQTASKKHSI